jgi:hypothetical protein
VMMVRYILSNKKDYTSDGHYLGCLIMLTRDLVGGSGRVLLNVVRRL